MRERDSVSTWGKYIRVVVIYNFCAACKFNQSRIFDVFRSVYVQWRDRELSGCDVESTPRINIHVTHHAFDQVVHWEIVSLHLKLSYQLPTCAFSNRHRWAHHRPTMTVGVGGRSTSTFRELAPHFVKPHGVQRTHVKPQGALVRGHLRQPLTNVWAGRERPNLHGNSRG
jgi:hypothetical protein